MGWTRDARRSGPPHRPRRLARPYGPGGGCRRKPGGCGGGEAERPRPLAKTLPGSAGKGTARLLRPRRKRLQRSIGEGLLAEAGGGRWAEAAAPGGCDPGVRATSPGRPARQCRQSRRGSPQPSAVEGRERGGGSWDRESAALVGTAGGMGSSSLKGRPGTRRQPQAWPEPGSRRVGRVGAVTSPGRGAEACRWPGGGTAVDQVRDPRTFWISHQEQTAQWLALQRALPTAHRLLEESIDSGTAWSLLGSTWLSLGETAGAEWRSTGLKVNRRVRKVCDWPSYLCSATSVSFLLT